MSYVVIGGGLVGGHILKYLPNNKKIYLISDKIDYKYLSTLTNKSINFIESLFFKSMFDKVPSNIDALFISGGCLVNNYDKDVRKSLKIDGILLTSLLEFIKKKNIKKLVFMSTKNVNNCSNNNISAYVCMKTLLEQMLMFECKNNDIKYYIVRSSGIIGFSSIQTQNWLSKWFRKCLVNNIFKDMLTEEQKEFYVCFADELIEKVMGTICDCQDVIIDTKDIEYKLRDLDESLKNVLENSGYVNPYIRSLKEEYDKYG